jgi:hypothetical protein
VDKEIRCTVCYGEGVIFLYKGKQIEPEYNKNHLIESEFRLCTACDGLGYKIITTE